MLIRILEGELKKDPYQKLPRMIGCVVYNGKKPFKQSLDLADCFADPAAARDDLLRPYTFVDVKAESDTHLMQHFHAGLLLSNMKYIDTKTYNDYLQWWMPYTKGVDDLLIQSAVQIIFRYWRGNDRITLAEFERANEFVRDEISKIAGDELMSLEAMIEARAEERGRAEGRVEGREEGAEQSREEIAKKLLAEGTDIRFVEKITSLSLASIKKLKEELETT